MNTSSSRLITNDETTDLLLSDVASSSKVLSKSASNSSRSNESNTSVNISNANHANNESTLASNSSLINNISSSESPTSLANMEYFLELTRYGNLNSIKDLIESNKSSFDINYRGKQKRFFGWTALHIACYFNQPEIAKYLLQFPDINVNICNYENDTPLHKASHSSRYEIAEMLLTNNADINMKNNEGLKPKDLAVDSSIKKLLQAAERTENHNIQKSFFEAISNNDLNAISKLAENKIFDINCTDTFGNTALHLAANRNQSQLAVFLIQKGINTLIKNHHNLTALDLAKTKEMKEIIGYVTSSTRRNYEGFLLKKRKFLGYKEYYVVLKNGSIYYYQNRKDASNEQNCRGKYFLNNAFVREYTTNGQHDYSAYSWTIHYTNGRKHTLCSAGPVKKKASSSNDQSSSSKQNKSSTSSNGQSKGSKTNLSKKSNLTPMERKKKWIDAIKEHILYSDSRMQIGENQVIMPLESLQQNLNILKLDEDKLNFLLIQIEQQFASLNNIGQQLPQPSVYQVINTFKASFENLKTQINVFIEDANKCIGLHDQRDSLLRAQLAESRSKCELLEQSLRVIAQENHDLETKTLGDDNPAKNSKSSPNNLDTITNENDHLVQATTSSNVNDDDTDEEFFDIPDEDDPLTEEEKDEQNRDEEDGETKSSSASQDADSIAQISCYGSIVDIPNEIIEHNKKEKKAPSIRDKDKTENKNNNAETNGENIESKLVNQVVEIERDAHGWRTRLPAKMIDRSQISIWSILKQSIGKDLSRIAMPAAWCEPLSFLQRFTENVCYSDLINKASDSTDPVRRFEYVCAFAVSNISFNHNRLSKPFNPLLGETYELIREDLNSKIVCEQVSHHPPISAFHSESIDSKNWKFYGCVNAKIKFWGKSMEVMPKGTLTLELNKYNETYTWQAVTCCIHNIIVGKLWFEYYGTMEVTCNQTGQKAVLNFKPYSWSNKELNKVDGFIYDKKKNKLRALYGYWTHCMYSCDPDKYENFLRSNKPLPMTPVDELFNEIRPNKANSNTLHTNHSDTSLSSKNLVDGDNQPLFTLNNGNDSQAENVKENLIEDVTQRKLNMKKTDPASFSSVSLPVNSSYQLSDVFEIWRARPLPPYTSDYYNFNYFTMSLNEFKDEHKNVIAPTDSRFRTDVRELEMGNLEGAGVEKNRLEEKQRESRKNRRDDYKPKWFQHAKHPITHEETWIFTNKYWQRQFHDCPDLF